MNMCLWRKIYVQLSLPLMKYNKISKGSYEVWFMRSGS